MSTFKLDEWDIKLIAYLKENGATSIRGMREIWAERCEMDVGFIHIAYVVSRMAEIVEACNPMTLNDFINASCPSRKWQYGMYGESDPKLSTDGLHWEMAAQVLASRIKLTEHKKLPGYKAGLAKLNA